MIKIVLISIVLMGGCSSKPSQEKKAETVDNPVTRYVDGLHEGLNKAEDVKELANQNSKDKEQIYQQILPE